MKTLKIKSFTIINCFLAAFIGFTLPVLAEQTEQSFTTAKRYNLVGQVTGVISPRPVAGAVFPAVRNTYNSQGLLQTVESGSLTNFQGESVAPSAWSGFTVLKKIIYTYDDEGKKLSESSIAISAAASTTEAAGAPSHTAVTEYSYDDYDRTTCVARRLNGVVLGNACSLGSDIGYGPDRVTRYEYTPDNFGLIYKEFRAVGTIHEQTYVTNTYDTYGRLTDQLDANNNRTHLDYNAQNRLETIYFPNKVSKNTYSLTDKEVYGYDNNGNRTSLLKRDGINTITYKYDALNREIEKIIPTPADGSQNVYTNYDLLNLKISGRFASATGVGVTYKYDGFGEVIEEQSNVTGTIYTVKNVYDKHGNRTGITHNDNKVFTYTYDDLDRSKDILEGGVGSPVLIRNNLDSFARISSQNTIGNVFTTINYDKLSRPYSIALSMNMAALNQSFKFKYNPVGQVVDETLTNDLYLYEESGSKTGSYTVNNLNQYTGVDSQAYGHDKNGNLACDGGHIESTQVCSATKFTYDVENRLVSTTGTRNATLKYDPNGRLVQITSGGQTTSFQYIGGQMIAEYKNGAMQNRYIFGEGMDRPLVSYTGSGVSSTARVFLHSNHQGSIALATDTSGNGKFINTYDAYGVPGKANQGRFGYTGQMWLPEIAMHYYKARIYYPQIGRFLQTDPIGYKDDMDLYTYVGNDPVNHTDPSGMAKCGSSLSSGDCEKALDDADRARNAAMGVAAGLKDIAGRMKSGKMTDSDKAVINIVKDKFGSKFGTEKGLNRLANGLNKAADRIGARGEGAVLAQGSNKPIRGEVPDGYVVGGSFGNTIYLNDKYFDHRSGTRDQIMLHEGAHLAGAWRDQYINKGENKLFNNNFPIFGAQRNADTYGCLVFPGPCGF